jgi:hypothetical protein
MLDYLPENIGIAFVFGYRSIANVEEFFEWVSNNITFIVGN